MSDGGGRVDISPEPLLHYLTDSIHYTALLTVVLEGRVHPDDVRVAELGERPLLHVYLVVDVLVPSLQAAHLGLLDYLEGERLAGAPVLGLCVRGFWGLCEGF